MKGILKSRSIIPAHDIYTNETKGCHRRGSPYGNCKVQS